MNDDLQMSKKDKFLVIDWLIDNFPSTFFKKSTQIKPLKIGIFNDILDFYERFTPPFSKKALREAINYYSRSPAYLSCQKEHASRVDIYGIEVGVVTAEQAKYAKTCYQNHYAKKKMA